MTRQEILQWEVDNRNLNNRCKKGTACLYYIPYKTGCAVGRLLTKKKAKQIEEIVEKTGQGSVFAVFELLPEEVRFLGLDFLADIQIFHDNCYYFTNKGLSSSGIEKAKKIAEKYNLNITIKE